MRESIAQQSNSEITHEWLSGWLMERSLSKLYKTKYGPKGVGVVVVNLKPLTALTKAAKGLHTTNTCGFQSNLCLRLGRGEWGGSESIVSLCF